MMSYNAGWQLSHSGYNAATGCIAWPEALWSAFEGQLARPSSQQGYFYVQDEFGDFLGHVHYEVQSDRAAQIGLNVIPTRRGDGLGFLFMNLLLEQVWQDTDASVAVNDFEDDRSDAVQLHRHCGFIPDTSTTNTFGRPTRAWRLYRADSR